MSRPNWRANSDAWHARAEAAEAERDAYRKAKQENDERFQLEAMQQRDRAEAAEREARAEALRDAAEAMPDFDGTVHLGACQSCVGNTVGDVECWLNDRADWEDYTDE